MHAPRSQDEAPRTPPRREWRIALAIAVVSLALRFLIASHCDIFQDEALYWWEAHERGVNFCPHPPAASLAVRGGLALLGDNVLGLRVASLAWGTAAILVVFALGRDLYGPRAGLWAAALFASCPLFMGVSTITTPDSLLVLVWLLFMWAAWRAASGTGWLWWAAAGALVAAGFYTKYMMVLALPCTFLALLASPRGRALLRRPRPWLALGLGSALFVPVFLAWNAGNDWAAIRYHLSSRHHWEFAWGDAVRYVAAHAGAISPLTLVGVLAGFVAAWRSWRRGDWSAAWVIAFGFLPIAFFLLPSAFTRRGLMRVQWDEVGYAVGTIGFAAAVVGRTGAAGARRAWRRLGVGALVMACAVSGALIIGSRWPRAALGLGLRAPTRQTIGWRELAQRVREIRSSWQGEEPLIVANSFSTLFCLAVHLHQRDGLYTLESRANVRYGLVEELGVWRVDEEHLTQRLGRSAPTLGVLFIDEHFGTDSDPWHARIPRRIRRSFASVERLEPLVITRGGHMIKHFTLCACRGWRGAAAPGPAETRLPVAEDAR